MIATDSCGEHSRPGVAELEISIFGSGFGECLAVHVPGGKWLIVDSCRNDDGQPAALAYLDQIGVSAVNDVRVVLASHWHVDHVDGIASVVGRCESAEAVISGALHSRELFAYAGAAHYLGEAVPAAIRELRELAESIKQTRPRRVLTTAQARMELFHHEHGGVVSSVKALSPSPAAVHSAISDLRRMRLRAGTRVSFPRPDHNGAAVVLQVRAGDIGVLLASDLEEHADPARGWRAVADGFSGERLRDVVKVSHHGSANGNSDCIWDELMVPHPLGLITHFHNGSVHLPMEDQLSSICEKCEQLFSTSGPAWQPSRLSMMDAASKLNAGQKLGWSSPGLGHVRARIVPGEGGWRVGTCGQAETVKRSRSCN